jgi:hypothetical protein
LMILYHFIVDFMEVNFTDFIDYVFALESDKTETCNTRENTLAAESGEKMETHRQRVEKCREI